MKKNLKLILIIFLLSMLFVFAAHEVARNSASQVDEDTVYMLNFSINNTNVLGIENISTVNVTIPSSFTFLNASNSTTANVVTFSNTTLLLSWYNVSGLIPNATNHTFTFNITASTPGTFNITVLTMNATTITRNNISLTVNDTTDPSSIEFVAPGVTNNSNRTVNSLPVNVSVTDNWNITTISIRLYNATAQLRNYTSNITGDIDSSWYYVNFTTLADGIYYVNATVNDTSGNYNNSITKTITIDTTVPVVTHSCLPIAVLQGELIACTCTGSDNVDSVPARTAFTTNPSTGTAGTFTTDCTYQDYTGNVKTDTITYTVASTGGSSSSGSSSGSGATTTFVVTAKQFEDGFVKYLGVEQGLKVKILEEYHTIAVLELTETTAKLRILSDPQEETFSVGDQKKFDVDANGFYDILVTLDAIVDSKAKVSIKQWNEKVPETVTETTTSEETTTPEEVTPAEQPEEKSSLLWLWILIGILVVAAVVIIILNVKKKK